MLGIFEIHEPETVQEASALLADYGYEATVYAGGTELLLLMKEGLVHYPHLINVKTIPGLDKVFLDDDQQSLHVGSLVTHRQLEGSSLVEKHAPLLSEVEAQVANVRVRAAGTLGGNLCFAEPHSDPATLLLAWGATLELSSANGRRELPVDEFFVDLFETARQDDELLTGIKLRLLPPRTVGAYERFSLHERPTVTVAALLRVNDGAVEEARLALGSVGPIPVRVPEAEEILRGEPPGDDAFEAAAECAYHAADPVDDLYGSADYKRHLARVLTVRALNTAVEQAQGGTDGR
jgi:carbon-monoxide dehydrogenase medium subunit